MVVFWSLWPPACQGRGSQPGRSSSRSRGANHSGRTARSRRRTVNTAASTRGIGRNAVRGTVGPSSKVHHGAQAAERSVVGGTAERLRATSNWTSRSARTGPFSGISNSLSNRAVVRPKGGLATTRYVSVGHFIVRKSAQTISMRSLSPACRTFSRRRLAHTGSFSTAITRAPVRARGMVRAPRPAPTSTIRSSRCGSTVRTIRLISVWSARKFWPSERRRASRGVRRRLADTDHHRHSHGHKATSRPRIVRRNYP